tara:strand:+ start:738 stop:1007 length:270 start_codon:yes stop_codon:yes gene_type:complete
MSTAQEMIEQVVNGADPESLNDVVVEASEIAASLDAAKKAQSELAKIDPSAYRGTGKFEKNIGKSLRMVRVEIEELVSVLEKANQSANS